MNRIASLRVLAVTVAAVFFLITCSNPEPQIDPPIVGGGDSSSSDSDIVVGLPSSSSDSIELPPPKGGEDSSSSEQGTEPNSSDSGQESSSNSDNGSSGSPNTQNDSSSSGIGTSVSSSAGAAGGATSSAGIANSSSSSNVVLGSSSSRAQSASSSSRASSSSSRASSSSRSSSSAVSSSSVRSSSSVAAVPPVNTPKADFTETINGVSFDMIYVPGGTFTLGCEKSSGCPADTSPKDAEVSSYFIAKTEVKNGLWKAVMGSDIPPPQYAQNSGSATHITWYDAMEFTCKLSNLTGRKYHMTTEAEWEYAAKKYKDKLSDIGGGSGVSGEEWAYNSWNSTHTGGKDPVGPGSGQHTQKTRRDANGTSDNIVGRLIRSIEGIGPALRLAVSADMNYPPTYVSPCDLHAPKMEGEPTNSYRDPRWVTGSSAMWVPNGTIAIGGFGLRTWDDGTARLCSGYMNSCANGQWFTSNNVALVFVPSSGSIKKYAYIFLDEKQGSLISGDGFANGYIGRIEKRDTTSYDKPTVSGLKSSGEELAKAQANFETEFKMVDMTNIPASAQKQDSRLLDGGATKGWFQNNTSAGGVHHYRKDVDPDEFRFTVNQNNGRTMLANGTWFTVNNIFLRVKHKDGYTAEYLYAVDSDGTFYHNSFMGYERGDFRMFKKETNGDAWPKTTCGNICSEEIPKGLGASMYSSQGATGKSTFVPAPCPSGGCR